MTTGELTVFVSGLPTDARPRIEILRWDLRVVTRAISGQPIELPQGRYVLRVLRPGRDEEVQVVSLEAGGSELVVLAAGSAARSRDIVGSAAMSAASSFAGPPRDLADHPGADDTITWYARIVSASDGLRCDVPSPIAQLDDAVTQGDLSSVVVDFDLTPIDEGDFPVVAQVAREGMIPLNVMLPASPGQGARLRVLLDESLGHLSVAAAPTPDDEPAAQTLAAYLASGLNLEAVEIGEDPPRANTPLFNVLAALAMLRLRPGDRPSLDIDPVPWLPDSLVIAAETALREDDEGAARRLFAESLARGLPIFTDSLSMLARRRTDGLLDGASSGAIHLLATAAVRADRATLTATFAAADASEPDNQEPVVDFEGWFAFRRQTLEDWALT